ncbi:hypothetical protein [Streptomyces purpureus]|uniref:hypothetical protein n=1 Tax=Streptomyces purpureus TaxID=1951 RepID=UPI0003755D2B|nr:hypothetical protein [Streptomyces purpureus]
MDFARCGRIGAHLALVWAVGYVTSVSGIFLLPGGPAGVAMAAVVALPLLAAAALPVRTVVPWCRSPRGLLGWAALVFGAGAALLLAGARWAESVRLHAGVESEFLGELVVVSGLPFVLAAAALIPGWAPRAVVAVLVAAGVAWAVDIRGQAAVNKAAYETKLTERYGPPQVRAVLPPGVERSELLIPPTPPGFRIADGATFEGRHIVLHFERRDGADGSTGGLRYVSGGRTVGPCVADPAPTSCTDEGDGFTRVVRRQDDGTAVTTLFLRRGEIYHELGGPLPAAELRRMLLAIRPATDAEVLAALNEPGA